MNITAQGSFSDEAIRRFLLGQLNANEQSTFERDLFASDELENRVRLAELALADEFARDRLNPHEKNQFQENYLASAERKQMLGVSQALHDRFSSPRISYLSGTQRLRAVFDLSQPAWRYAFAALILLLVFATFWLGVKEPRLVERILPTRRSAPRPSPTQTPVVTHHSIAPDAPAHPEPTPTLPPHEVTVSAVALDQSNTRDNLAVVSLPKNGRLLRFELLLKSGPDTYRAELWNSTGQSLFSADALVPANGKVTVDIPVEVLPAGAYEINLSRMNDGATENVAAYFFRMHEQ